MLPGIADWRDSSRLPRLCRDLLEEASGITIPSSKFVLKVILAYLIAVVPLNWLICRFVLNRREWTWVVVPVVALVLRGRRGTGGRAATSAMTRPPTRSICWRCTAIIRALISRGSCRSTPPGVPQFTISYPNDPTALALPIDSGRSIRGEDVARSIFESYPVPTLADFTVQPRSMSMFRAEQMVGLAGAIRLEREGNTRRLVNGSELELRDAVLIDLSAEKAGRERALGTIAPGASVELAQAAGERPAGGRRRRARPRPEPVLEGAADDLGDSRREQG